MTRLYRDLRALMVKEGVDAMYLAHKLNVHENTFSRAMTGRRSWTLSECYAILDILHEPPERLPELFPKGGIKHG